MNAFKHLWIHVLPLYEIITYQLSCFFSCSNKIFDTSFYNVHSGKFLYNICCLFQLWLFKENPFSLDVKFNDDGTRIIASRLLIQAVNISDTNGEKEMVRALRNVCHQSPLNVSVFHPYFVFFDQVNKVFQCFPMFEILLVYVGEELGCVM